MFNQQQPEMHHRRHHKKKLFMFVVFLMLAGFLIYPLFYGPLPFTGSIISSPNSAQIETNAEDASTKLQGSFSKIELRGSSEGQLYAGESTYNLNNLDDTRIILEDYTGKIYFNEQKLVLLEGKATSVTLNGIQISSQSGNQMPVSLGEFAYRSLKINDIFSSNFAS